MTRAQYTDLWNIHIEPLATELMIPSYEDHLLRRNQREDYLDIFRGTNTRENRRGSKDIPYPHPFFNSDGSPKLKAKPAIKHLLIGEAAPEVGPADPISACAELVGDQANSYFYDIRHLKETPYFSAPRIAFNCVNERPCPENKTKALLCLASKGVLLLDLFPFSLEYTTALRQKLNTHGITKFFWISSANPYSLQNRLNRMHYLLSKDWDLCLVAPGKISDFILNPENGLPPLAIRTSGKHPSTFRDILPAPTRYYDSQWRKLTITSANVGPSSHLISIAF
jgi:hypothetical protein